MNVEDMSRFVRAVESGETRNIEKRIFGMEEGLCTTKGFGFRNGSTFQFCSSGLFLVLWLLVFYICCLNVTREREVREINVGPLIGSEVTRGDAITAVALLSSKEIGDKNV